MIRLGVVAAGPAVRIADGTQASAGDLILWPRLSCSDPGGRQARWPSESTVDRRTLIKGRAARYQVTLIGGVMATQPASASSSPGTVSNVVLVHGAYADGSSWSEVIERLQGAAG